ncbi:MAG: ABC transporter ATP-binding protein [Bacteroidetes bacterium]|nr:ABC transporter ATP-binding protein [Bacteroidota bacterium]MDA0888627.1 ABC transporter ATP-binding protein [Bacteroidota bacterium]MDA1084842.1 ABC transporter ATP-binding protein [Bacteroidota bacterium]
MSTILNVTNLTKKFGRLTAVNELSFTIEKGNVYGILGPNGSGKSTTLGMILNVVNPTSGTFSWFDGTQNTHQALKRVGAIIERPNFYPYMTAAENLRLVCRIKEVPQSKIEEKLELVDLLDRKNDTFKTYSLGMKQRLAIASALLNDPEILILDEPTNGLDPQGIAQVRGIIKKIAAQGTTILLASHLLDEVEKVCSHVLVLQKGKRIYFGKVTALTTDHGYFELNSTDVTALQNILEKHNDIDKIEILDSYILAYPNKTISAAELSKSLSEQGIIITHFAQKHKSLEEQFLSLTKNQQL